MEEITVCLVSCVCVILCPPTLFDIDLNYLLHWLFYLKFTRIATLMYA